MKERQTKNRQDPEAAGREFPDLDSVVELFVQLNSARKTGEFCSCDHPQCLRAVKRAVEIVNGFGEKAGEVIFSAGDRSIIIGGKRLETTESYLADFAAALRAAGITVIRLAGGASTDGLVRFIRLLAACSDPEVGDGQICQFLCGPVAEGVRVGMSPSTKYEVPTAHRTAGERPAGGGPAIEAAGWEEEVRHLLGVASAESASTNEERDPVVLTDVDPRRMAELINELDSIGSIDTISGQFLTRYLNQANADQAGEETGVPEWISARFLHLIRALSPGHQVEFISALLETSHTNTEFAGTVLEALPIHLASQAFSEIEKTQENTVHPRIASQFETLCKITGWRTAGSDSDTGEDAPPAETQPKTLVTAPATLALDPKAVSALTAAFSPAGKRKALTRLSLDLLERSTSLDETRAYCDSLPGLFTEALSEGDWAGLNRDWSELTGLVRRGREAEPFLGQALQRIRKSFLTIQAMEQVVKGIDSGTPETRSVLQEWIPALGTSAGESLVIALVASNNRIQRRNLLSAIVTFGEAAIPMALKRINDHRWYVVRNMISIVREVGDRRAAQGLLTLSKHYQFQVRRELINTLLTLDHPEGLELAVQGIRSRDQKMRSACIGLLGSHRVDGSRDVLLQVLKAREDEGDPFSQAQKVSAVWALGQIGNGAVLPALHGLLKKQRLFRTPASHELKMAILRSLPGYPLRDAKTLARWGASHGDEDEAATCTRLLRKISVHPKEKSE